MTNRLLRKALLEKLNVTQPALSYRVKRLKKQCPMTTEDATYVIAQQEGIILDKYLDKETIDRVRSLQNTLAQTTTLPSKSKAIEGSKARMRGEQRIIIIGKEFKSTDPILQHKKISEAKQMAAIYPLLYILENSIREVIDHLMTKHCGSDWWDSKAPKGLKDTVNKRMSDENKNLWHQRRGARPIDYLDLNQLPTLLRNMQGDIIPDIVPSIEWFTQFIDEVYKSRCVVCHMNPLDNTNIQAVKLKFTQWQRQIAEKKDLIL